MKFRSISKEEFMSGSPKPSKGAPPSGRTGMGANYIMNRKNYEDEFDKELSKVENAAKMKGKGVITDNERKMIEKYDRRLKAKSMMRTSNPEVRETKRQMINRKKKDLGIVGQLTEGELSSIKRSMTADERRMFNK